MRKRSENALVPRNGHNLVVAIVARISGCAGQTELSLDDQVDHAKEAVADLYDGPVEFAIIATKGKGEALDRPELTKIEDELRSGRYDLFVIDDLGRLVRGGEATRLLGIGVDHGTRSITLHECIDTADDTWEQDALSACSDHVGHNALTSKRLKQKLMNRFRKSGGAMALPIYGYLLPPDAKTYQDWQKDDGATSIINEGATRLRHGLNCSATADWLNASGVPTGPYCSLDEWDGPMVRRFYANPILKGMPQRGKKRTEKHHETGRRVSKNSPVSPSYFGVPHLAHLESQVFDELNAVLNEANCKRKRPLINGLDPLLGVPRKRTRFPGQHARCWYCGRILLWGAKGITDNLMCKGSRNWQCWNSIGISGPLLAEKLVHEICNQLGRLEGLDTQFAELVSVASNESAGSTVLVLDELTRQTEGLAEAKRNVEAAILEYGPRDFIQAQLKEIDLKQHALAARTAALGSQRDRKLVMPKSASELRELMENKFRRLAIESSEFGDLMRLLVPEIYVYQVRLIDGGRLWPRAKVRLNLAGTYPDVAMSQKLSKLVTRDVTIDVFDPPHHERIRPEVARWSEQGLRQLEISNRLPGHPHQATISNAICLHRSMIAMQLDSPYVTVFEPPADLPKLRRHKNARYEFEPLDGYVQLQL